MSPGTEKPISVMLVDDHAMFRQALSLALEEYDHLTVPYLAASGEEALDILDAAHPDVVLMDISLPGMNGLETIREAVRRRPQRMIALSMHDKAAYESAAQTAGAAAYVFKAAPIPDLVSLIEDVARGTPRGGEPHEQ